MIWGDVLLDHLNKLHYKEDDGKHIVAGDGAEKERVKVPTAW